MNLKNKKYKPREDNASPLSFVKIEEMLKDVPGWHLENNKLVKEFKFKNFKEAISFVNKTAELAEDEGHHPDIFLHSWNKVKIILWTHTVNGLSEKDFIMAAKIYDI